jgi:hypothetical protein
MPSLASRCLNYIHTTYRCILLLITIVTLAWVGITVVGYYTLCHERRSQGNVDNNTTNSTNLVCQEIH